MPLVANSLRTLSSALIAAALLIAAIVLGRDILVPLALAGISCFVLVPVVRWLKRKCVPETAAVALVVVLVSGILIAGSVALSSQLLSLAADLPAYRTNVLDKVRSVVGSSAPTGIVGRAIDAIESYQQMLDRELHLSTPSANSTTVTTTPSTAGDANSAPKPESQIVVINDKDENTALRGIRIFAEPLAQMALTFLFTLFLLMQYKDLRDRIVRVFGTENMSETTAAMSDAGDRLSDLFTGQAILNASFGTVVGIVLMVLGVPNAPLWGAIAFIMRFVPFVGSYIAAIPPILLAAAVDPGWTKALCTVALFAIGEPIMGQVLEPLYLGKRAGLSPFAMILSTSFWTLAWGPIGLVLAAPLTLVLVVLGKYVPSLEFMSVLLGDEAPLSAQQDLYHRLLSGDPFAVISQIEDAEQGTTRERVLDNVMFPALALAARDRRRGRLDAEACEELEDTVDEVISRWSEVPPPETPRILIVPARGNIDVLAARIAVDAMNRRNASATTTADFSGLTALTSVDTATAQRVEQVVFITVTGISGKLLMFMGNRAKQLFPKARVQFLDLRNPPGSGQVERIDETMPTYPGLSDFAASNPGPAAAQKPNTSFPALVDHVTEANDAA